MIHAVLGFLALSLLFYVLFGGADFGAGILEFFLGKEKREEQRKLISHAMAPVWEANHIWLVLAVVIFFTAFPKKFALVCIHFHLPMMLFLVGLVLRGCAFTFRYYDSEKSYYRIYSRVFSAASLLSSFTMGVIYGGLAFGEVNPTSLSYYESYVAPWFNPTSMAIGLFSVCLCTFLAAAYLVGEAEDEVVREVFVRRVKTAAVFMLMSGAVVLVLQSQLLFHPIGGGTVAMATLLWLPFVWVLQKKQTVATRALAIVIVGLVLTGAGVFQYPSVLTTPVAPPETLRALLFALVVGSLLIFPALGYLFHIFKWGTIEKGD